MPGVAVQLRDDEMIPALGRTALAGIRLLVTGMLQPGAPRTRASAIIRRTSASRGNDDRMAANSSDCLGMSTTTHVDTTPFPRVLWKKPNFEPSGQSDTIGEAPLWVLARRSSGHRIVTTSTIRLEFPIPSF